MGRRGTQGSSRSSQLLNNEEEDGARAPEGIPKEGRTQEDKKFGVC